MIYYAGSQPWNNIDMVRRLYQSNNAYKYHEPFTVARTAAKPIKLQMYSWQQRLRIMVSLQTLLGNTQAIRSVSYQSRAGLNSLLGKYTYLILRKCIICSVCWQTPRVGFCLTFYSSKGWNVEHLQVDRIQPQQSTRFTANH